MPIGFTPVPSVAHRSLDEFYLDILGENIAAKELACQEDQERSRSAMDSFFREKQAEDDYLFTTFTKVFHP